MRRPNILFFMVDQMQARLLESDHPCRTPNFDRLAKEGVRFTRAYTPNNICSPTRASLMTGLLPHNHGVLEVLYPRTPDQHNLRLDKPHWAQRLSESGYRTGYFGKWHVEKSNDLNRFGWEVDGGQAGVLFKEAVQDLLGGEPLVPECDVTCYLDEPAGYRPHLFYGVTERHADERFMGVTTTMALDFVEDASEVSDPWCCFVSLFEPHDPFIASQDAYDSYDGVDLPEPVNGDDDLVDRPGLYRKIQRVWKQLSAEERREARRCYYASITEIDAQFGRVYDALSESGKLEETVIVVTADHGDLLGAHGLFFKDISVFEEVYNVPLIVRGPGVEQDAVCEGRVAVHDLCPTLLDVAGLKPFDVPDSQSFKDLLSQPDALRPDHQRGYSQYFGNRHRLTQRVVWDGPWKFVFNGFDFDELYNLDDDPYEMTNLALLPDHASDLERMTKVFWRMALDVDDTPLIETHYPMLRLGVVGPDAAESREQ
jgi:choline-sulfatase